MAIKTQKQKFADVKAAPVERPLPPTPKLPESLRKRFPDLAKDFDRYDIEWEEYQKKLALGNLYA